MRVLIVGDYPPPYGGSSVQVSVLHQRLSAVPGVTCRVLDIGTSRRRRRPECLPARHGVEFGARLLAHAGRGYLIHLHTNGHTPKSWTMTLACAAAGLVNGRRTLVSIGSGSAPDFVLAAGPATRRVVRAALRLIGGVVVRNERARAVVASLGVPEDRIAIVSGFYGMGTDRPARIPEPIDAFLRAHAPVVAAISSPGPEYGIPLFLEAMRGLRAAHPRLGVLLMGRERFGDPVLDGSLLATGELPRPLLLAVMARVSLFVRPTYFDGDASSVREALMLGVPVVASDTDFRPAPAVRFRRGDAGDLAEKVRAALEHAGPVPPPARPPDPGSLERLLAIYARLLRSSGPTRGQP